MDEHIKQFDYKGSNIKIDFWYCDHESIQGEIDISTLESGYNLNYFFDADIEDGLPEPRGTAYGSEYVNLPWELRLQITTIIRNFWVDAGANL